MPGMEPSLSHDTLLHRVLRPAVACLAGTPVTPDILTALRLATGLGSAGCFAAGPGWMGTGAGLFLVSMLLDRADGELARRTGRFSRIGPRFDLVSDCVSIMAAFIGLGIGATAGLPIDRTLEPQAGLLLGVLAAVSTAMIFAQLDTLPPAAGGSGKGAVPRRAVDPDDVMLVVPLAVWCGDASWILLAGGVLTPLAMIAVSIVRLTGRDRRPAVAK